MLVDSTWYLVHNSERGMLCVGCIEARLGRQLVATDFNDSYLNSSRSFERSARLLDRMRRWDAQPKRLFTGPKNYRKRLSSRATPTLGSELSATLSSCA